MTISKFLFSSMAVYKISKINLIFIKCVNWLYIIKKYLNLKIHLNYFDWLKFTILNNILQTCCCIFYTRILIFSRPQKFLGQLWLWKQGDVIFVTLSIKLP